MGHLINDGTVIYLIEFQLSFYTFPYEMLPKEEEEREVD